MSPLQGNSYRLPPHAVKFFGSKKSDPFWGGVPWAQSQRRAASLLGLASGGLQTFPGGDTERAVFWESDCDIDYDGPSPTKSAMQLKHEDQYWLPGTTLMWPGDKAWKQFDGKLTRYCDSRTFRGAVMPPQFKAYGLKIGDFCVCVHNGYFEAGQLYDLGPKAKIGEVSHAMAGSLKIPNSPKFGNDVRDLCTLAFPGSGPGYAVSAPDQWEAVVQLMGKLTGRID